MATEADPATAKKMKQGMSFSRKEKVIILNVFKYFRQEFTDLSISEVVRRTAKATGCSEKSVYQFRKQESSAEGLREPVTRRARKGLQINSRDVKYDQTVRQAIRNIVYTLKCKSTLAASLSAILKEVNINPQLPNLSLMTLRRLLFDMGFRYEKDGNKSILVEKPIIDKKENQQPISKKSKRAAKPTTKQPNNSEATETKVIEPIEYKYIPPPANLRQYEPVIAPHPQMYHQPVYGCGPVNHWMQQQPPHTFMKHE